MSFKWRRALGCIKIIIILVPCLSAEGREIIQNAHSYYVSILYRVVSEIMGEPDKVVVRLCDLLALLPSFEVRREEKTGSPSCFQKAATIQDDSFSLMNLEDICGLNNNIVTDYHLRRIYRS